MLEDALYIFFCGLPFLTCLWWSVTIAVDIINKRSPRSSLLFLLFVLVGTLLYFCHFIHFAAEDSSPVRGIFDSIWIFCTLSVYPLFGLWVYSLAIPSRKYLFSIGMGYIMALAPGFILSVLSFVLLFLGKEQSSLLLIVKLVFAVEVIVTVFLGVKSLRAFRREVSNYYADTDGRELKSVGRMLVLLLVVSCCSMVSNLIGRTFFMHSMLLALPSSVFAILQYSICYIGHRPVFDVRAFQAELAPEEGEEEELPEPGPDSMDDLLARICSLMEKEHFYRQHGLKVSDFAAAVGSNRTYVSNCINRKLGITFSEFVSSYRVKDAIEQMKQSEGPLNLETIGWNAGFSGRSQFYRSFKKETGVSPGQWSAKS